MALAERLLQEGRSDEDVERLARVSLNAILALRARLATAASRHDQTRLRGGRLGSAS